MPEHRNAAPADPADSTARTLELPDLTGVDLRTLRHKGDGALDAAVSDVLLHPADYGQTWYSDGASGTAATPR